MPRFHFQLDPLLRQRRRQEQALQAALAEIERERADIEAAAHRLTRAAQSSRDALRDSLDPSVPKNTPSTHLTGATPPAPAPPPNPVSARIDPAQARWQATAAGAADVKARQLAIKLAGVLKRRDDARDRLAQAAAQRRAVESLREQRLQSFNRDQRRREEASIDDINNARNAIATAEINAQPTHHTAPTTRQRSTQP